MEVFVGADYKGFELKNELLKFLVMNDYSTTDEGVYEYVEGDDYNDPAVKVSLSVRENPGSFGILICDSAHGMTMQANRFKGIRAANCDSPESAILAHEHDDANVLCLSARFMDADKLQKVVEAFLKTNFNNIERRVRRVNRLDEREDYD